MEEAMKQVKMRLRSLVVSSPTQMDACQLQRDYVKLLGAPIPLAKLGYRDFVAFLRERCSDSFLLTGPPSNPILTVIVPDSSKHIDNFVQKSRVPSTSKVKTKRRSIPEAKVKPPKQDLIYKSFVKHTLNAIEDPKKAEVKAPDIISNNPIQNKENVNYNKNTTVTSNDVKNFLKKRLPLYNTSHHFEETSAEKDRAFLLSQDDDSGKHTLSSSSSTKALQFEELKSEIMELITAAPEGVWCTDLIRLYRERYNRELNFTRFGYTSILSLAYALEARVQITRPTDTGDWRLAERCGAAPGPPAPRPCRTQPRAAPPPAPDPDDALPGIDFDPDVFPADCVRFLEQIPALSLADCRPGAMLEVMVGEVYSPSHFWLIRLGDNYNIAMEEMMDEMMLYYSGEGRARVLARGALRVGHYCAALYEGDWHRAVIVKIIDSDTVKVRHVDYGTVEAVATHSLRALLRRWARLPAQAVRARLAGVRPAAAGRRWPHAAAAQLLRAVRDARLVANVVAVDTEHDVLETLLIDTRGADDVCLSSELIRAGHADARADSALRVSDDGSLSDVSASASELAGSAPRRLRTWDADAAPALAVLRRRCELHERLQAQPSHETAECYLYPRFDALERGDTPNLAEINVYLRDGIALDYVEAYRLHVPMCLPAPACLPAPVCLPAPACVPRPPADTPPASPQDSEDSTLHDFYVACSPPSPEPGELATRIPLLWPGASPSPAPAVPSPAFENPASISPPCPAPPLCPAPPPCPSPLTCSSRPLPSASPSPLLHTPSALSDEQAPRDSSPPAVPLKPSVTKKPAINPEAQVFTPRQNFRSQPAVHFPTLFPPPAHGVFPPPGQYLIPAGQWFGPYPVPGGVTLSLVECDTYSMLARVNPEAAHWYMAGTLGRAMGGPSGMGGPGPMSGPVAMGGPFITGGPSAMGGPGAMGGPVITGGLSAMGGPGAMWRPSAMGGPGAMGGPVITGGPSAMGSPGAVGHLRAPPGFGAK